MLLNITPQKAGAIAKKAGVTMPKHGEEFLVGRMGNKLGCFSDPQPGCKYYFKLYGDTLSRVKGMDEFNFK